MVALQPQNWGGAFGVPSLQNAQKVTWKLKLLVWQVNQGTFPQT